MTKKKTSLESISFKHELSVSFTLFVIFAKDSRKDEFWINSTVFELWTNLGEGVSIKPESLLNLNRILYVYQILN